MKNLKLQFLLIFLFSSTIISAQDTGTFIDKRDGHAYQWVKIGDQIWMTENLAYEAESGCWVYGDDESNLATYGRLYDWDTAITVSPAGWHLPTDAEWEQLAKYISNDNGGYSKSEDHWSDAGAHLKSKTGWEDNGNGTNDYGFLGLPGGYRTYYGFFNVGSYGIWWSATGDTNYHAWHRYLSSDSTKFCRNYGNDAFGFSVRCLKN